MYLSVSNDVLIAAAKAFGITEFINPNDSKEPVQQVILEPRERADASINIYSERNKDLSSQPVQ